MVPNCYDYDYDWFTNYTKAVNHKSLEEVHAFWKEHVADTADEWDYLTRHVGLKKMSALRTDPRYHYNPSIDRFKKEGK